LQNKTTPLAIFPTMFATRAATRLTSATTIASRGFHTSPRSLRKVAVLGAGGGIGQPMSLLLKTDPLVTKLSLYDIRGAPGVAADISHVNTNSEVKGYEQAE
jgi:malate dehydrogenase